jgi:histidyl-tRNA synthetase
LDKRGKITDEEIHKMLSEAGLDNDGSKAVFNLLNLSTLDDVTRVFAAPPPSLIAVTQLLDILDAYGIRGLMKFDISVVRGLSYYTGTVFEAFDIHRKFRAIFGGGRYDNLLNDIGGTPATAVGLGFGDVVVTELLQDLGKLQIRPVPRGMAVGFMEESQRVTAAALATALRRKGESVDLGLRPERPKNFFSRAGKSNTHAIYVGPDDITKGTVRIKDLATRTETEKKISEIIEAAHG